MTVILTNNQGCLVSYSHITGDLVCQEPGEDCDCLITAKKEDSDEDKSQDA